jgi:hypothetical protein
VGRFQESCEDEGKLQEQEEQEERELIVKY